MSVGRRDRRIGGALAVVVLALSLAGAVPGLAADASLVVNEAGDAPDATAADGRCDADLAADGDQCTLRAAIQQANASAGEDRIEFVLTRGTTIRPAAALPTITDPVVIDGTTQPTGRVELDGSLTPSNTSGLTISAGASTVRGLAINRFKAHGMRLLTNGGNTIEGNYVGLDAAGNADLGNEQSGIVIESGTGNAIGGAAAEARNVISGNGSLGLQILAAATDTIVRGNYIGTDATGELAVGNTNDGIQINASNTVVERNLVSGNRWGILVQGGSGSSIRGNYVGTDKDGDQPLGNAFAGVQINGGDSSDATAENNVVGGSRAGEANVISANGTHGVVFGQAASGNRIEGNLIGLDAGGAIDLGNGSHGVVIGSPNHSVVGNVIAGNGGGGVLLQATGKQPDNTTIRGNRIGTNAAGTAAVPNAGDGVVVQAGTGSTIGGPGAGEGNLVSGNGTSSTADGIQITAGAHVVQGNSIGTDAAGAAALPNAGHGVNLFSGGNLVGGTALGAGNRIAFNADDGVAVSAGSGNRILGNSIEANGTAAGDVAIDLGGNGPTPNDAAPDADTGTNGLQNFPVITSAVGAASGTVVEGTLTSAASTTFRIELFDTTDCDAGGHGEAARFLGAFDVTTDGAGVASFSSTTTTVASGFVTATATDPGGNTSELSSCRAATAPPATLSVADASVIEGTGGATTVAVTVTRSSGAGAASVDYATADGSATSGADYAGARGTLAFADGETSKSLIAAVEPDAVDEPDEAFLVNLSGASGATIADEQAVVTIVDDDERALPAFAVDDVTVREGDGSAVFTVSRSSGEATASVSYATADGSAAAGADYAAVRGTLEFSAGETRKTVAVPLLDDAVDEPDEAFVLDLSAAVNATLADAQGQGSIVDDEPLPSLAAADASVVEGTGGASSAAVVVTLSGLSSQSVTVAYATADGTAVAPYDYASVAGTLTFAAGTTTQRIAIPLVADAVDETDETFVVDLSTPAGAALGDPRSTVTIADDDLPPKGSAIVTVEESVSVADGVTVQPPQPLLVEEAIVTTDESVVLVPRTVTIDDFVVVADGTDVSPAAAVRVDELVGVTDGVLSFPALSLLVADAVVVTGAAAAAVAAAVLVEDGVAVAADGTVLPPTAIVVEEILAVSDVPTAHAPISITIEESVTAGDGEAPSARREPATRTAGVARAAMCAAPVPPDLLAHLETFGSVPGPEAREPRHTARDNQPRRPERGLRCSSYDVGR